jgi:hypothetical protein
MDEAMKEVKKPNYGLVTNYGNKDNGNYIFF